ncbi:hypothetical protein ACIQW9_00475 [Herminiimonas sp. NPDC097707]|uniref:hypothetical protein n=1 Tax=Herminiimonas sp. NPDC097707 TaxID=3364007 RepID=UPI00383BDC85
MMDQQDIPFIKAASGKLVVQLREVRSAGQVKRIASFGDQQVWWELTGQDEYMPAPLQVHDMAATALVFVAMHRGQDMYIDGPVTFSLLKNLEDLIACWVAWRPDLYKHIHVSAAHELADDALRLPPMPQAVAAFSGGLDASFTAWRHVTGRAGRRSYHLLAGVLIQGFDIALNADAAFNITVASAADSLQSINVPMVTLKTNWRDVACVNWEMEFGNGVATCLRNWQGSAHAGLVGSDEDYTRLVLPWGGNPITYAMLSSRDFQVVYDGGEFARTEKAERILDWETGLRNLRVCWEGPITGRNCGRCEKCLRTKLNFMAVGAELPESLAGKPSEAQIRALRAGNHAQLVLLDEIVQIAEKRNIKAPWLNALKLTIRKNRFLNQFSIFSAIRRTLGKIKRQLVPR